MVQGKEVIDGVEWRIRMADGSSEVLVPATGLVRKAWLAIEGLVSGLALKIWMFWKKAWDMGSNDPRKVIHCLKVGLALTIVSLFYLMRPLYDGVGGNAMWAVMTVVVVIEPTVGATIYKCLNRVCGTSLAGCLAVGVHWVASQSGQRFEPVVVGASVFLLASAATFSRLIPSTKSLFDYGAMIFILTFSFVAISGYRVDKLFGLAHQRISTIIIGTSLCIVVIILVCPIWSGQELHSLIVRNMDKLADSLEGCVTQYFNESLEGTNSKEEADKKLQSYKCVLSSKATEESMANFARWEPSHGRFNFRHPWKQYLKIGASMRSCAYCIEALSSCINSENQAAEFVKKHLSTSCLKVSSSSSATVREIAKTVKTMKKSSNIDMLVGEMNAAVQELHNDLKSLSHLLNPSPTPENKKLEAAIEATAATIPLVEIIPVVTLASILIETAVRIQALYDSVEELAKLAGFKIQDDKSKRGKMKDKLVTDEEESEGTMKALQRIHLFRTRPFRRSCGEVNYDNSSKEEKISFQRAVASGELSKMIEPWDPWWLKSAARTICLIKDGTRLVQPMAIEEALEDNVESSRSSGIPAGPDTPLPPLRKLISAEPSPLLAVHLVDIVYSHCFTLRIYNGDWQSDAIGSAMVVLSISSVLGLDSLKLCRKLFPLAWSKLAPQLTGIWMVFNSDWLWWMMWLACFLLDTLP